MSNTSKSETKGCMFPVIEQERARELFKQLRYMRDNIDAALTWDETLSKYQRARLTTACNLLEQADTEICNLVRSFRKDGAGYAIEK